MATKGRSQPRNARAPRGRQLAKAVAGHWLLVLASHIIATVVVLFVERLLSVPWGR